MITEWKPNFISWSVAFYDGRSICSELNSSFFLTFQCHAVVWLIKFPGNHTLSQNDITMRTDLAALGILEQKPDVDDLYFSGEIFKMNSYLWMEN